MGDSVVAGVLKNLAQVGEETVEKVAEEPVKIVQSVITGTELVADAKQLTGEEEAKINAEEDKKKQEARAEVRNVEKEMQVIRDEKKQKEKQEEEEFLKKLQLQREAEARERQEMEAESEVSTNPAKQKKSRGSAFVTGKKKSQPQLDQMSQTSEFKGKID